MKRVIKYSIFLIWNNQRYNQIIDKEEVSTIDEELSNLIIDNYFKHLFESKELGQLEEIIEGVIILLLNISPQQCFNQKILDISNSHEFISRTVSNTIYYLNHEEEELEKLFDLKKDKEVLIWQPI